MKKKKRKNKTKQNKNLVKIIPGVTDFIFQRLRGESFIG